MKKVLVACEESQIITSAFRSAGFQAFSNDLVDCSGGHPEWHIKGDCLDVIPSDDWDLVIAHPPCTYLCISGQRWHYPGRSELTELASDFFLKVCSFPVKRMCVENPIGIMSSRFRKPDQIIQPYYFGDPIQKSTCFWLFNLPPLFPTSIVEPLSRVSRSGRVYPVILYYSGKRRSELRSKFFPGVAQAMVDQWSNLI